MVNCKDCLKDLSEYLEGCLDDELRRELQAHLNGCHHCKVIFDTTRKTVELYCDGRVFPLPDNVRLRLHSALRRRWEKKRA